MGYENLRPDTIESAGRYDSFDDGKVMFGKQKNKLPAMGGTAGMHLEVAIRRLLLK